jgi:hypothetical protein
MRVPGAFEQSRVVDFDLIGVDVGVDVEGAFEVASAGLLAAPCASPLALPHSFSPPLLLQLAS